MTIKLCQHFDPFETWTLNGNAAIAHSAKFGKHSLLCPDRDSFLNISNNSGLFNLAPSSSKEFECFIRPHIDTEALLNNGFAIYNEHIFKLFRYSKSWADAMTYCEAMAGHLATITSQDKQNFIAGLANGNHLWLGGIKVHDAWTWITGENWDFSNWNDGEPNGSGIYLNLEGNSGWDNEDGNSNYCFVCEWDDLLSATLANLGYRFFNGHSFKLFDTSVQWHDAKSACENLGGHLATSTSSDKNNFLKSMLNSSGAWLGATDEENEGTWVWLTGEEWDYTNWASWNGQPNNIGGDEDFLNINPDGSWSDCGPGDPSCLYQSYICEWDYDFRDFSHIFNFDQALSLRLLNNGSLHLHSPVWNINSTSTAVLASDAWHHILLRFSDYYATVFLDGSLVISAPISGDDITPDSFKLGGFSGYIDEFVVRDDAQDSTPTVPNRPYETVRRDNSAPVSFAVWSSNDLPDGLSLSKSGLLEGTPTQTGTFISHVSVTTDWGTATKTLRIVITNDN